jgi:hypothetical protein
MLRKVTLKPFTSVTKVSPASLMIDGIEIQFSKVVDDGQMAEER